MLISAGSAKGAVAPETRRRQKNSPPELSQAPVFVIEIAGGGSVR